MTHSSRPLLIAALAAVLAGSSGCESNALPVARPGIPAPVTADLGSTLGQPLDAALLEPPHSIFHIGPGDRLEVETMGDTASRATVTVGPDGKIYFDILPGIDVWGLTLAEASDRIALEFKKFVRERPAVTVTLRSAASQQVWVLGRLNNPGAYAIDGPKSLLNLVVEAGGLGVNTPVGGLGSEDADLSRSFLIRDGHMVPVDFQRLLHEGDLSQNVYLQAGDFVYVPPFRSSQVHVLGAVLQPRSERMAGSLTVIEAIALAGGTVPQACLANVAILRGSLAHPQIAIVAVNLVLVGKAPDVRLEPGDIVYVPYTPERILERYVTLILDTFVRTVGVNEGAYMVSSKSKPVSVGVNLSP